MTGQKIRRLVHPLRIEYDLADDQKTCPCCRHPLHRMGELVTHPAFGYRVSYRRILEIEARMLARWLEGDLPAWEPLVTR